MLPPSDCHVSFVSREWGRSQHQNSSWGRWGSRSSRDDLERWWPPCRSAGRPHPCGGWTWSLCALLNGTKGNDEEEICRDTKKWKAALWLWFMTNVYPCSESGLIYFIGQRIQGWIWSICQRDSPWLYTQRLLFRKFFKVLGLVEEVLSTAALVTQCVVSELNYLWPDQANLSDLFTINHWCVME